MKNLFWSLKMYILFFYFRFDGDHFLTWVFQLKKFPFQINFNIFQITDISIIWALNLSIKPPNRGFLDNQTARYDEGGTLNLRRLWSMTHTVWAHENDMIKKIFTKYNEIILSHSLFSETFVWRQKVIVYNDCDE